jgi:ferredoxin, 2Fe-2S
MAKIIYIEANGKQHVVELESGLTVMEGAKRNGIEGIDAVCGGACQCATCHVYVDPAWQTRVGARTELEAAMLEFAEDVQPNSRLSCQIEVNPQLEGLVVRIPENKP